MTTGMESHRGYKALLEGCQELGLSKRLAKEFVRYCIVKNFNSDASDLPLSPSAQLDSLQHWVLLNTNDRRDVESLVGPIEHSTKSSLLSEKEKSLRRLKTMELMSKEGWSPSIDLWEESGTIFVNIHKVDFEILIGQHDPQRELQTENSFSMYYTDYVGAELVLAQIVQGQHSRPPIKVKAPWQACPLVTEAMDSVVQNENKRARVERISFCVRTSQGQVIKLVSNNETPFAKIYKAVAHKLNINEFSFRLMYDEKFVDRLKAVSEVLGVESGDNIVIDMLHHQVGC